MTQESLGLGVPSTACTNENRTMYLHIHCSTMTLIETSGIHVLAYVVVVRTNVSRCEIDVLERPASAWRLGATCKINDSVCGGETRDIDEVDVVPKECRGVGIRLVELGVAETRRY